MNIAVYHLLLYAVELIVNTLLMLVLTGLLNLLFRKPFFNKWHSTLSLIVMAVTVDTLFDIAKVHGVLGWLTGPPVTLSK